MSTESVEDAVSLLRGWNILDGCDDALLNQVKYFHAFSNMGALFVTSDDEVYGIGQNGKHNLLGVDGDDFAQEFFEEPVKVERLCSQGVIEISVGMWLGAAVTREGILYRWGSLSEEADVVLPTQVTLLEDTEFVQVACGAAFLAALTANHCVYVWGSMNMCTDPTEAQLVSGPQSVSSFACGWWHVAMLTDKGHVYTCGYGEDGQLGYTWYEHDDIYEPKRTDIRPTVKQVACGSISTLCLSTYGEIWACGANDVWQGFLGVDSEADCISAPMKVCVDAIIRDIAAAWGAPNIYAALGAEGRVFCWGESRYPATLTNISSLIEACRNERTSFDLDLISFPIDQRSSSIRPLVLQGDLPNEMLPIADRGEIESVIHCSGIESSSNDRESDINPTDIEESSPVNENRQNELNSELENEHEETVENEFDPNDPLGIQDDPSTVETESPAEVEEVIEVGIE